MGKFITYSSSEKELVKEGFAAVEKVLTGTDTEAKERLLLCLDYYMDPYFGQKLPYEPDLIHLLETVLISDNIVSVKEDAIQLLCDYTLPPYPVLQSDFERIEDELKPDVRYLISRQED